MLVILRINKLYKRIFSFTKSGLINEIKVLADAELVLSRSEYTTSGFLAIKVNNNHMKTIEKRVVAISSSTKEKSSRNGLFSLFLKLCLLLKLADSGLIQIIPIQLSILSCIDISHLFHTLFFVSHIFSTNPVPLHFFIIVCSSGGLQVRLLFRE